MSNNTTDSDSTAKTTQHSDIDASTFNPDDSMEIFTLEEREIDPRAVILWLTELRHRREVTQAEMAQSMQCTASRISRIERAEDRHLGLAETAQYIEALGMSCTLKVYDDLMPMDVQMRRTVLETARLLCRLCRLLKFRGEKRQFAQVERFIGSTMSPLFIEFMDDAMLQRDAAFGAMHAELAPGA